MMLEVTDMHAYYGKSHILQGVNINVKEGEIVALLGRNGVGRSTTCKAIMGEVEPRGRSSSRARKLPVRRRFKSPIWASAMYRKTETFFPD